MTGAQFAFYLFRSLSLDVDHHSGMQTFYHGCELFGASIFPQQLPYSSLPNVVKCLREVDKDNIQRSILFYAHDMKAADK